MIPRPFGRIAGAVAMLAALSSAAAAAEPSACALESEPQSLPDAVACLARADLTGAPDAIERLFERARQETAGGRFDAAGSLLDCAASVGSATSDAAHRYPLVRLRAVLDYRRERLPRALARFECALALSRAAGDREGVARDLSAVGSTLRRLGDFHGALAHLTQALEQARNAGSDAAAVLNNLGDVYRDLGDPDQSLRHYGEAERLYLERGDAGHAAHVQESMAVVELERGRANEAAAALRDALAAYTAAGQHDFALRVHGWLMRAALAAGTRDDALRWRAAGEALATSHGLSLPASFVLQAARVARVSGAAGEAVQRLQAALARDTGSEEERAALTLELAAAQEAVGDWSGALASLRRAQAGAQAVAAARHDLALAWLRTRFETAERDRTIAALEAERRLREAELRQRNLWSGLLAMLALALLLLGGLALQRRRQREREQQAVALARKEEEILRYRREAAALLEDRQWLRTLLDSRGEALCLLDAEGQVLAANRAARAWLADDGTELVGRPIGELITASDRDALQAALEQMEDSPAQSFALAADAATPRRVRLSPWAEGDGRIVMELLDERASSAVPPAQAEPDPVDADTAEATLRDAFRRRLVELMLAAVEMWERGTRRSRLDLAEASRIWRVAVDDGRLRARSMDRYLSLARLPRHPRWRDVLRTAYYVLETCSGDDAARTGLQQQIDAVLAHTRRRALL